MIVEASARSTRSSRRPRSVTDRVVQESSIVTYLQIPIICIANDRTAQKMKPLQHTTYNLTFKRPEAATVRSRILSIAHRCVLPSCNQWGSDSLFREKLKIPANVIDQLINGAQSDIRQVLNMLSTWKLSSDSMDFDEGKTLYVSV